MPRAGRVHIEGGLYHVYNRVSRGERVFEDECEAVEFVGRLQEVVERDGLTVFAWCLMENHYHLAVQAGEVTLARPMASLQQRVTRGFNARHRVFGPLWQGRYRAILVESQRYLDRLLVYIHLNPVTAGLVDDPADYAWSGHAELLGAERAPIVAVDDVLRLFGRTRRAARASYVRAVKGGVEEPWIGEEPGRLPWWRLGRPPKGEDEDPDDAVRVHRQQRVPGPDFRPKLTAQEFVIRGVGVLGVTLEGLRSRARAPALVEAREVLATVGVERYGMRVKDLAAAMCKSPDGVGKAISRLTRRRIDNDEVARSVDALDSALSAI